MYPGRPNWTASHAHALMHGGGNFCTPGGHFFTFADESAKFVFTTFIDNTGVDGVGWSQRAGDAYVAVIGILTAQYSLSGKIIDAIR